jgi:hypothetical protein
MAANSAITENNVLLEGEGERQVQGEEAQLKWMKKLSPKQTADPSATLPRISCEELLDR